MLITCKLPRNWFYRRRFPFSNPVVLTSIVEQQYLHVRRLDLIAKTRKILPERIIFLLGTKIKCLIYESPWMGKYFAPIQSLRAISHAECPMTYPARQFWFSTSSVVSSRILWRKIYERTAGAPLSSFESQKYQKNSFRNFFCRFEWRKLSSTDLLKYLRRAFRKFVDAKSFSFARQISFSRQIINPSDVIVCVAVSHQNSFFWRCVGELDLKSFTTVSHFAAREKGLNSQNTMEKTWWTVSDAVLVFKCTKITNM